MPLRTLRVRALNKLDFDEIKDIYEKFYINEFEFPDFIKHYLLSFVIDDDNGIIAVSGVRTISEVILMTNKDRSVRVRRDALIRILEASSYVASQSGFSSIHAFVQDEKWERHLAKFGFKPTAGKSLILNF